MRQGIMILGLVAVAAFGFAQNTATPVGGWTVYTSPATLLDPAFAIADFTQGQASITIAYTPELRLMITFPRFLASENEAHDKDVLFVTNAVAAARQLRGAYRASTSRLRWSGPAAQAVLDDIEQAAEVVFRTYDFRGNRVDAVFTELVPADTLAAVAKLREVTKP